MPHDSWRPGGSMPHGWVQEESWAGNRTADVLSKLGIDDPIIHPACGCARSPRRHPAVAPDLNALRTNALFTVAVLLWLQADVGAVVRGDAGPHQKLALAVRCNGAVICCG